eukprot:TRINITY_DN65501_c0_g1_i1.p1 TRINITY_DN65501_c0_g1~~TRINITY_DN65501_c0_g1_i1.p1  ORF type:complete len:289 (-),score=37.19 TRINITY_DN65501_c0_g1_i1:288-1091(-)
MQASRSSLPSLDRGKLPRSRGSTGSICALGARTLACEQPFSATSSGWVRRPNLPAAGTFGAGPQAVAGEKAPMTPAQAIKASLADTLAAAQAELAGLAAVLFLDVDGVLHPTHARHPGVQFQRPCMNLLAEVIHRTGATIVLSTFWRLDPLARQTVDDQLREHGIAESVSKTPNIATLRRSREIMAWVKRFRPVTWVAVDDWPLLEENEAMAQHVVQTRPRFGLQRDTAERIVELFDLQKGSKGVHKEPVDVNKALGRLGVASVAGA